jgi:riboflavin synthase
MFTGIIEKVAEVSQVRSAGKKVCFTFKTNGWKRIKVGDSIAVSGVCLTVVHFTPHSLTVEAIPTTLHVTNLGRLKKGSRVNLERALMVNDRLNGHFVQGHVDGVCGIEEIIKKKEEWIFKFQIPRHLKKFLIIKGSVAIDGISLTIQKITNDALWIAIIPHTLKHTTLKDRKAGDFVNLEVDFLAKYLYAWNQEKKK